VPARTLKNVFVEPESSVPYLISDWRVRSSAEEIGTYIVSTVRNAAKFAVYVDTMISVKNHHTLPTILPDAELTKPETINSTKVKLSAQVKRNWNKTETKQFQKYFETVFVSAKTKRPGRETF